VTDVKGLTEEQVAALRTLAEKGDLLLDLALRAQERRSRNGRASGEVHKNDWTPEQAKLYGLQRSMRSVMRAHENSLARLKAAQAEHDRTAGDIAMVRQQIDEYLAAHPELIEAES
jgi:hypothetical protein